MMVAVMCVMLPQAVMAREPKVDSANTAVVAGNDVHVSGDMFADTIMGSFAAGRKVTFENLETKDSVAAAGFSVDAKSATIGGSMFAAASDISVNGTYVDGNFAGAGYHIDLNGIDANGIYAVGQKIFFDGSANALHAAGNEVTIAGQVNGDVDISAKEVIITKSAVITGKLTIDSANRPKIAQDAQIGELIYRNTDKETSEVTQKSVAAMFFASVIAAITDALYWVGATIIIGVLMRALFGRVIDDAVMMLKSKKGAMFLVGLLPWLLVPLASIIAAVTIIGMPLAALAMVGYVFFVSIGTAFAAVVLSELIFPRMNKYLSAIITIVIIEFVEAIPVFGLIVSIAADLMVLGYVAIRIFSKKKRI